MRVYVRHRQTKCRNASQRRLVRLPQQINAVAAVSNAPPLLVCDKDNALPRTVGARVCMCFGEKKAAAAAHIAIKWDGQLGNYLHKPMQLHIYIIFAQQYVYARSVAPTVTNATIYMQNQAVIYKYAYILYIMHFHISCSYALYKHVCRYVSNSPSQQRHASVIFMYLRYLYMYLCGDNKAWVRMRERFTGSWLCCRSHPYAGIYVCVRFVQCDDIKWCETKLFSQPLKTCAAFAVGSVLKI